MSTVSIIIPIFNVEYYIRRCLNSVINQTYKNIECILVDDCGTDNSISIAQEIIREYIGPINFIILHHNANRGLSAARNTGTNAATGKWVFYLDSDDAISENTIELMIKESQNNPSVDMIVGNVISDSNKDFYLLHFKKYPFVIKDNKKIRQLFFNPEYTIPVMAWNKLIRRDFIIRTKISFKEGLIHEDELWIFHIVKQLQSILFINNFTYYHFQTTGSIMVNTSKNKSIYNWATILSEMLDNIDRPFPKLQLIFIVNKYLTFYNDLRKLASFKKLTAKLRIQLCKYRLFKIIILTYMINKSNRIFQRTAYHIVPNLFKQLSLNPQ